MPKRIVQIDLRRILQSLLHVLLVALLFIVKIIYTIGYQVRCAVTLLFFTLYRALFLTIRISRLGDHIRKLIRHTPGSRTFNQSLHLFWNGVKLELLHVLTGFQKKNIVFPIPPEHRRKYARAVIRRAILYSTPVIAAFVLIILIFSAKEYTLGVKVLVNGSSAGVLANQSDYASIKRRVDSYVSSVTAQPFDTAEHATVSFAVTLANKEDFANTQPIEDALVASAGSLISESYGVYVDGDLVGAYNSKKDLDSLLSSILAKYKPKDDPNARVEFVEDVRVLRSVVPQNKMMTLEAIKKKLLATTVGEKTYKVVQNDVFVSIAKSFNMTTGELSSLNPSVSPDKLSIGMSLVVKRPVSFLPVKVIKTEKVAQSIPFKTTKKNSSSLYVGQIHVQTTGKKGTSVISSEVFTVDDVEISRHQVSSVVKTQPVPQVELIGTKILPKKAATGRFRWPASGTISSRFGPRRSGYHTGLDIACHVGTPVVAADGGTVIFAGRGGSYGLLIKIDHGNGYQTWYAHLSSLLVKKGTKVAKGETIAKSGNTGNTTGPHLHFEVRKNGKAQNPINYLP